MECANIKKSITAVVVLFSLGLSSCASGRTSRSSDQVYFRVRGSEKIGKIRGRELASIKENTLTWRWPLARNRVTSHFGDRGNDHHDGIDLRASIGTPVFAAAEGVVVYAGARIRGYGKMIVLKHASGLSTVYAHNSKLVVSEGGRVRRGQKIALSGNSGRSSGPHVHFEIRRGTKAINPVALLPKKLAPEPSRRVDRRLASDSSIRRR